MGFMPQSIESIARLGANIELTGKSILMPQSVLSIITIAMRAGGHVTIDAKGYMPQTLEEFAKAGKNRVTIRI